MTRARLRDGRSADLRIDAGSIAAIAPALERTAHDTVIDAAGALLIPGLHDHHIHLVALAAALTSLDCGPPRVADADALAAALRAANSEPGTWLRGIGYHPCVAGDIDRDWLDRHIPDRPARIQHRGGRLWVLNSRALEALELKPGDAPAGLELHEGRATGRLYEADVWLRQRLGGRLPDLAPASALLAAHGITGITDTTPHNDADTWARFARAQRDGVLSQRVRMMGGVSLAGCIDSAMLQRGEFKVHLLESQLPDFDALCTDIAAAHAAQRGVAVHCVTLTELVFTLGALREAGVRPGDRIEHASVTPPQQLDEMRAMGLRVVTQPHFIAERGDQYRVDVEPGDRDWLYRGAGFLDAGVPLAAGSDAPFGSADPWAAMRAAVQRTTAAGELMGSGEQLTPEQALALFLSPLSQPGAAPRELQAGDPADLCLLHLPWEAVRDELDCSAVRMTWRGGEVTYSAA
ncbi:hypothetical protein E4634_01365 [Mangrovimicrobium sediminis]|uniref:Amidohydrolase 3 domain-containing protein n=1 Tax=Mangrovimicrobium sediminis TaxID=2562682 RepID=A0A4Z0MA77_9GAMM|nr:hypothetical protein E4634_01365 [Haliea sp. SAOS-164]